MLVSERRVKTRFDRFRSFLNTWRGALTVILATVALTYAALSILLTFTLDSDIGYTILYYFGFLIAPLYATFKSLATGTIALSEAVDRKTPQDWVAAGIPPNEVGKQLLMVKAIRLFPVAVICSLIFLAAFLVAMNTEGAYNDFVIWQAPAIVVAFMLFQYMFVGFSCYISLLTRTLTARFISVTGYFIIHASFPIVAVAMLSNVIDSYFNETLLGIAVFSLHPYGPLFSSVFISEGSIFEIDPVQNYFIGIVVQIAYSLMVYKAALKMFERKIQE